MRERRMGHDGCRVQKVGACVLPKLLPRLQAQQRRDAGTIEQLDQVRADCRATEGGVALDLLEVGGILGSERKRSDAAIGINELSGTRRYADQAKAGV